MPRVVFDTVIFVRALINPFGIWGRLVFEYADAYALIISPPVVAEILEVLRRPELVARFRSLAGVDRLRVIEILECAEAVAIDDITPVSRDPKDDKFLETARAGFADYVVSEDKDLLVLGTYDGVPIITASRFLTILEGSG